MLQQMTELGTPPWPKRDASRTVSAWPLRHRELPPDAGYIPHYRFEQRVPHRHGPARVGLDFIIIFFLFSDKIAPFETKLTNLRLTRHSEGALATEEST